MQRGQEKLQTRYKSFNEEYPGVLCAAAEVMPDYTKMYLGYMREYLVRREFGEQARRFFGSCCTFIDFEKEEQKELREVFWNPKDGSFTVVFEDNSIMYWFAHQVAQIVPIEKHAVGLVSFNDKGESFGCIIYKHYEYES